MRSFSHQAFHTCGSAVVLDVHTHKPPHARATLGREYEQYPLALAQVPPWHKQLVCSNQLNSIVVLPHKRGLDWAI